MARWHWERSCFRPLCLPRNLDILSAGPVRRGGFADADWGWCWRSFSNEAEAWNYDWVVIDSPPRLVLRTAGDCRTRPIAVIYRGPGPGRKPKSGAQVASVVEPSASESAPNYRHRAQWRSGDDEASQLFTNYSPPPTTVTTRRRDSEKRNLTMISTCKAVMWIYL